MGTITNSNLESCENEIKFNSNEVLSTTDCWVYAYSNVPGFLFTILFWRGWAGEKGDFAILVKKNLEQRSAN